MHPSKRLNGLRRKKAKRQRFKKHAKDTGELAIPSVDIIVNIFLLVLVPWAEVMR
jgi:hypothetical protein